MESKIAFLWHFLCRFRQFSVLSTPSHPLLLVPPIDTFVSKNSAHLVQKYAWQKFSFSHYSLVPVLCERNYRFVSVHLWGLLLGFSNRLQLGYGQNSTGTIPGWLSYKFPSQLKVTDKCREFFILHLKSIKEGIISRTNEPLTPWPFWPC